MSKSILSRPKVANDGSWNGFDVGMRRIFSAPAGMLLPVYSDWLNPGEKVKCNADALVRTEAVETAAFMRLKLHLDWFFVPVSQLMSTFGEFYYGVNDIHSTYVDQSKNAQFAPPLANIFQPIADYGGFTELVKVKQNLTEGKVYPYFVVDEFGVPYIHNLRRLYDLFGYGSISTTPAIDIAPGSNPPLFNTNLFKYLAYHKIYFSHYNNSQFFKNDPTLYNVDQYVSSGTIPASATARIISTMHYRPYRKDFFTNIQPAPVFNMSWVNSLGIVSNGISNWLSFATTEDVNPEGLYATTLDNLSSFGEPGIEMDLSGNPINPADLRAMFAYEKLMRITANAGCHYDDQTLAHFGYKMPKGISKEAYYLGSQATDINISEVVATASTGANGAGSVLGDIAGKGFGTTGGQPDCNFEAPEHGLVMCIASIEPLADYASQGVEEFNRFADRFDYYTPEFDNVGMVPAIDYTFLRNWIGYTHPHDAFDGWTYRYASAKLKFDVVNESIWNTYRSTWAGTKQNLYDEYAPGGFLPLQPVGETKFMDIPLSSIFYIAPQYTNSVFLQSFPCYRNPIDGSDSAPIPLVNGSLPPFDPETDDAESYFTAWKRWDGLGWNVSGRDFIQSSNTYVGDNFLINLNIKCFKSSKMSVHSLPKLM